MSSSYTLAFAPMTEGRNARRNGRISSERQICKFFVTKIEILGNLVTAIRVPAGACSILRPNACDSSVWNMIFAKRRTA